MPRTATIARKTNETDIALTLDLDGTGVAKARTDVGFFDHMLDLLARLRRLPGVSSTETFLYLKLHRQRYDWGTR